MEIKYTELVVKSITENGEEFVVNKLKDMVLCSTRRNHESHMEFSKQLLSWTLAHIRNNKLNQLFQ